jgi:outer membrane protein assembly factor BamD
MLNPSCRRTWILAAAAIAALLAAPAFYAQAPTDPAQTTQNPTTTTQTPVGPVTGSSQTTIGPDGKPQESATLSLSNKSKPKKPKPERVQQTKDTKREIKKTDKYNALLGKDEQLPDKQLYDKALAQEKSGHFDIARLDLQTLLNTYPDSQYQMRAKLAVADCWYKEGGTAALTQAEQEYNDFITFFPNAPEAAEAQMRIGDIYFKQMDIPDRDYGKAIHAEDAYRTMLKQYPDAPTTVTAEATQKLREVQEVLATRDSLTAAFYGSHANWSAAIARYQTVVDTYPQYSHMDDDLIGMGDAYEAEANAVRAQPTCSAIVKTACFGEGAKAALLREFDGRAADAYRNVVLLHSAAPHVEDAKERLVGMNLPIPTPTATQVAASEALEGSRAQYTMTKRLQVLFLHSPDVVVAARIGDPPLEDPAATTAPAVMKYFRESFAAAANPGIAPPTAPGAMAPTAPTTAAPAEPGTAAPTAPASTNAPTLSDVPTAGNGTASDPSINTVENAPASTSGTGTGLGVEILSTGQPTTAPASNLPAATGAPDPNNGLTAVGPKDTSALPPVEKPADAPDALNEVQNKPQPAAAPAPANASNHTKAPALDKNDESSSKDKPKKGIDKLNPF